MWQGTCTGASRHYYNLYLNAYSQCSHPAKSFSFGWSTHLKIDVRFCLSSFFFFNIYCILICSCNRLYSHCSICSNLCITPPSTVCSAQQYYNSVSECKGLIQFQPSSCPGLELKQELPSFCENSVIIRETDCLVIIMP